MLVFSPPAEVSDCLPIPPDTLQLRTKMQPTSNVILILIRELYVRKLGLSFLRLLNRNHKACLLPNVHSGTKNCDPLQLLLKR